MQNSLSHFGANGGAPEFPWEVVGVRHVQDIHFQEQVTTHSGALSEETWKDNILRKNMLGSNLAFRFSGMGLR